MWEISLTHYNLKFVFMFLEDNFMFVFFFNYVNLKAILPPGEINKILLLVFNVCVSFYYIK